MWTWEVSGRGRPVPDRTGLTGTTCPNAPLPDGGASAPPDLSIVPAIRKQLGLQLDPGKGPREFLVIDHVKRPSGN